MSTYTCIMCLEAFSSESDEEAQKLYVDHLEDCIEPSKDSINDLMEMFGVDTKQKGVYKSWGN